MVCMFMRDQDQIGRRGTAELRRTAFFARWKGGWIGNNTFAVPGENYACMMHGMNRQIAVRGGDLVILRRLCHGRGGGQQRNRRAAQRQAEHRGCGAENANYLHESSPLLMAWADPQKPDGAAQGYSPRSVLCLWRNPKNRIGIPAR